MKNESANNHGIVMIVDDTPSNLAYLSDTLQEAGYRVLVATNGHDALAQINLLKPDIILMDVLMPDIDGFETCRQLKADPLKADIPVLFMTGLSELDHLLRGFSEGGLDYIIKPIRPQEVLARINVHLNLSRDKLRAENALSISTYSALAINASGIITWLTPAAKALINESMQNGLSIEVDDYLPPPILNWAKQHIGSKQRNQSETSDDFLTNTGLTLRFSNHQISDEYMLWLKKHNQDWNLSSLKDSLGLTFREVEILMWIARGKTNKEVGLILESSPRTVNKHLEHVFEKLGVSTRAAAVAIILQRAGAE